MSDFNQESIQKSLKKAHQKMTFRIIRIVLICFCITIVLYNVPNILRSVQSNRIQNTQKAMMIAYELSAPLDVIGYGNSLNAYTSFHDPLTLYLRQTVGHNQFGTKQMDLTYDYNLLSGSIDMFYPASSGFLHKSCYAVMDDKYKDLNKEEASKVLEALKRNSTATVARVDVTFNETYTIEEINTLLKLYDLEIKWMAIETGREGDIPPKNIEMPAQQYNLFGIPPELRTPENIFSPVTFLEGKENSVSISTYKQNIINSLRWLLDNEKLIGKDNIWFINEETINTLESEEFKIYGITINGPSDEVLRFLSENNYLHLSLQGIEIYYW